MSNIISEKGGNGILPLSSLEELRPIYSYRFKLLRFELTCSLAQDFLKDGKKIPISVIFDVPPLLKLIYDSLKKHKHEIKERTMFKISSNEFAKIIFKGDKAPKSTHIRNISSVFDVVNAIKDKVTNKPLVNFLMQKGHACILSIEPEFMQFAKDNLERCQRGCIKIFPECNYYLSKLRKSQRAYVLFIEKLFFESAKQLCARTNVDFKFKFEDCKDRLKAVFFNPISKHHYSFSDIVKAGEKCLKAQGITEDLISKLACSIITTTNKAGKSPSSIFVSGHTSFEILHEKISKNESDAAILDFIQEHATTPNHKRALEMKYSQFQKPSVGVA